VSCTPARGARPPRARPRRQRDDQEVWIDHAQWNDFALAVQPGTPPIAEAVGLTAAIEYLEKLGMIASPEQRAR